MSELPAHLARILGLARWAPSGDNTQPWRFQVLGPEHVLVHGLDTRAHCVYDLDGHPSQLAHGALLETLCIAASAEGRRAHVRRRPDTPETHLLFDVRFESDPAMRPDPLVSSIEKRVVQRRPLSTRPLSAIQKQALEQALPAGWQVHWFQGLRGRWRLARLCYDNARIRLTIPEAYAVHRAIIEWNARYSLDRIPDRAVGLDAVNLRVMQWAMASWPRVHFLNTWLAGHLLPRVQMDLIPGLRCAAHFALMADTDRVSVDDYVQAGRVMQRFWLTAASLDLYVQPEMTPLIFARYVREGVPFTAHAPARETATALARRLDDLFAGQTARVFFLGRIGAGPAPASRSLRRPLSELLVS